MTIFLMLLFAQAVQPSPVGTLSSDDLDFSYIQSSRTQHGCKRIIITGGRGYYEFETKEDGTRSVHSVALQNHQDMAQQQRGSEKDTDQAISMLGLPGAFSTSDQAIAARRLSGMTALDNVFDQIKANENIKSFCISGHSTAALSVLAVWSKRDDIQCAIMSAPPFARWQWLRDNNLEQLAEGSDPYFDALEHVDVAALPEIDKIFLVAQPKDEIVVMEKHIRPFASKLYARFPEMEIVLAESVSGKAPFHDFGYIVSGLLAKC